MKKQFIFLGTFASLITPVATIVSCNNSNNENKGSSKIEKNLSSKEDVRKIFNGDFVISSPSEHLSKIDDIGFFSQPKGKSYGETALLNLDKNRKNNIENVYNDFYQNTIPLAETKFAQKNTYSEQSENHRFSPIYSFSDNSKDSLEVGTVPSDQKSNMLFSMWSYIERIIDWNKKARFTIPRPEDINIAHLNGKKIIGTCFFPWGNNPGVYKKLLEKDSQGNFKIADAMIKIAKELGFDGWFFNLESYNEAVTENKGNVGDKFKLKDEIEALEQELKTLNTSSDDYKAKSDTLELKRKQFHMFNVPDETKTEIGKFFEYINKNKNGLEINLYQYGIGEHIFDEKNFDNFFVDSQLRETWKERTKNESDNFKKRIWYGYYFGRYGFDMKNDKDDKWQPEGQTLEFKDYVNWWTFDFLNNEHPSEVRDLRFFSGYKGEDKNWTPANKWFLETTTIIDADKPFSSAFSLGLGDNFRLYGKKSNFQYRNAALQDILPTYRYLNYFYDENNKLIKTNKHNEELIQEIKVGTKGSDAYFGNNVLKYLYDLKPNEAKMTNKLFASNMDLKLGAKFRMVYRNTKANSIVPKLALWYDSNDTTKFIEVDSKPFRFVENAAKNKFWYRELEFEITQDVLDKIQGNEKKLYAFGTSFTKDENNKRISTALSFLEYIPPQYQTPSENTLQLEEVKTIWNKNVLTNQNVSIDAKFGNSSIIQNDLDPKNVRSSALTLKFKDFKPGQLKMNIFYSSKQENGFEKDEIIGISNNNSVVINSLPINKNIPIIVESYDFNHKLIGKNNFVLRTPFE